MYVRFDYSYMARMLLRTNVRPGGPDHHVWIGQAILHGPDSFSENQRLPDLTINVVRLITQTLPEALRPWYFTSIQLS